ncbi:MAG: ABC transporter ATP-binding protein [Deltaproteobacteria bacterium]|nr:MAG: ABC transporter ATP-binding protein [Deltaproteobacteria bacterium]
MHGLIDTSNKEGTSPHSRDIAVQVEGVSKHYGQIFAVSETSFQVPTGTIKGLVGSDGAGKTTLLRMIATMITPSKGSIKIQGLDVAKHRAKVKHLIGYMPQRFGLYPDLTVMENLKFFMDIYGISGKDRRQRIETYLGFTNLLPFLDRRAADLSGGMKQKLGLACVLVHEPSVLILDEPTNGVDPVSRQEFWDMLLEMKRRGMTILIATAYLDEGEKCDSILLMHRSKILAEATPKEIRSRYSTLEEAMLKRIEEADEALGHDGFKW